MIFFIDHFELDLNVLIAIDQELNKIFLSLYFFFLFNNVIYSTKFKINYHRKSIDFKRKHTNIRCQ